MRPSLPSTTDVFIVGAGPAGSTLAHDLAKRGLEVTLIDKADFPRAKTCGGGINFRALRLLPFDLSPVIEETIDSILFSCRFEDSFLRRSPQPILVTVQRKFLDLYLVAQAEKTGARFFPQTRFLSLHPHPEGIVVETTAGRCQARFLAGADGVHSGVARSLGLNPSGGHILVMHSEVPRFLFSGQESQAIHIDWGSLKRAYAYLFPRQDTLAIGAGGIGHPPSELKKYHQAFLQNRWKREGSFPFSTAGFLLPLRKRGTSLSQGRCLLLGDAAALIDPFTGEGIYYAIRSARIAAAMLEAALQERSPALALYGERIDQELMPELECSKVLRELFNLRPAFFHRRIATRERWWNAMVKILRGERTTVDFRKRLGLVGTILYRWYS